MPMPNKISLGEEVSSTVQPNHHKMDNCPSYTLHSNENQSVLLRSAHSGKQPRRKTEVVDKMSSKKHLSI